MTYIVVPSKQFQKTLRKLRRSGRKHVLHALTDVVDLLATRDDPRALNALGTRWKDHVLKGDKEGIRELHVGQDDLLLYDVDEKLKIVKLLDIVNHEELRRR